MVLRPRGRPPAEPWVVGVGRPVDIRYNDSNAPIDPRPWSRRQGPRRARARSAPTWSTRTSRWRRRRGCGPRSRRARRWWARSIRTPRARACTTSPRRCSAAWRAGWRCGSPCPNARRRSSARRIGGAFGIIPNGVDVDGVRRRRAGRPRRPGRQAPVRRQARRAQGVPGRDRRRSAAGRDAARTSVLVVVGDGPQRDAVDRLPARSRERVTMLGAVPQRGAPGGPRGVRPLPGSGRPAASRSGSSSSRRWRPGLPVVASDIPGYDEVSHEVEGLLVPPRDPAALAAAAAASWTIRPGRRGWARPGPSGPATSTGRSSSGRIEDAYRDALEIGCAAATIGPWASRGWIVIAVVVLLVAVGDLGVQPAREATGTAPTTVGPRSTSSSGAATT